MKFEKLRARVLDAKIVFRGNVESGNKPERKSLVRGRDFTSTKIKKIEYDESEKKKYMDTSCIKKIQKNGKQNVVCY